MPERLLSVISGILAGGIPGFRIELCCFYHPFAWPPCGSVFVLFSFFFGGHTHYDTQDVIVHVFLIAGSDPFSPCFFCLFVFGCSCLFLRVLFACLLLFVVWFLVCFLAGTARWTAYRSNTSTLGLSTK